MNELIKVENKDGREASKISREKEIEIKQVPDERFGAVKSYRIDILKQVFDI